MIRDVSAREQEVPPIDINGEYRIPAAVLEVWAALNDPVVLAACIPGCQELERESDTSFKGTVVTKVGIIKARLTGRVLLSDLVPPYSYTLSGQGDGRAAGFVKGSAKVRLRDDGPFTILRYEATAQVSGKLASVGSRLLQGVVRRNATLFFDAFCQRLGGTASLRDDVSTEEERMPD